MRPADGHEIKLGGIIQENLFNIGSTTAARRWRLIGLCHRSCTTTRDARWKYYKPEDNLFNWDVNVYTNRTESDQTKIAHMSGTSPGGVCSTPGNNISGCVDDKRSYELNTPVST